MAALVPIPAFTPDASVGCSAQPTAAAVQLPGTPASDNTLRVANLGSSPVAVKLGTDNTVTCTMSTGLVVPAGAVEYIGMVGKTWIAILTGAPGTSSTLNLTTGN